MGKRKRERVPNVLWTLYKDKARTLARTIASFIPQHCVCNAKGKCLHCVFGNGDDAAMSYLVRPDDPPDYVSLMYDCFVVVPDDAPPLPPRVTLTHHWSQLQIVERTIQALVNKKAAASNVICNGYQKFKVFSCIVKLLTHSTWDTALKRVGDSVMVYLLMHTLIFMPIKRNVHQQVAGSPVNRLSTKFAMHIPVPDSESSMQTRHPRKRRRGNWTNSNSEETSSKIPLKTVQQNPICAVGSRSEGFARTHCSEVSNRSHLTEAFKLAADCSEGKDVYAKKFSEKLIVKPGKRFRLSSWQRRERCKRLVLEESCTQEPSSKICIDEDDLQQNRRHVLINNQWQGQVVPTSDNIRDNEDRVHLRSEQLIQPLCPCCSVFQSLSQVPEDALINRRSIFYNSKCSSFLFLEKHILYSLKSGFAGINQLLRCIFGLSGAESKDLLANCYHKEGVCLHGSSCLYHSFIKLLKVFVRRAKQCPHTRLLEKHCSSQPPLNFGDADKGSTLQGNKMKLRLGSSEQDLHERVNLARYCKRTPEVIQGHFGLSQPYCLKNDVVAFVWAVCRNIIPPDLLGVSSSHRILRRILSRFIKLRRFENFSLKQCMSKLEMTNFQLLSDGESFKCFKAFAMNHGTKEIYTLRRILLERWIFWLFGHIVVPLLQANFYVTESDHGKQNVYYYRKSVWEKLSKEVTTSLMDRSYQPLDNASVAEILSKRAFGFSKVRLCPKEAGARPIANMKAPSRFCIRGFRSHARFPGKQRNGKACNRSNGVSYFKSVNTVLRDLHAVLKDLKMKKPEMWGSTVFSYNDIYKKLCGFLRHVKEGRASVPALYIVVSDVEKAFDTIQQDKLLSILSELQMANRYTLKSSSEIFCRKKSLWCPEKLKLTNQGNNSELEAAMPSVRQRSFHTLFVNQEKSKVIKGEELQFNLKQHLKKNVIKIGQCFFLQTVGIPQGSVLSTLLCTLYYGHLERNLIFPYLKKTAYDVRDQDDNSCIALEATSDVSFPSPSYLLLRFVDDLLFVSTSENQAASYLSRVKRGFLEYNCYMNEKKFCTNFDTGSILKFNPKRSLENGGVTFIRWSGLLFNSCSLEVQADYSRYLNDHMSSTLTMSWRCRPGRQLKAKLRAYMRPKCHPIFFDATINSPATIKLNVYQAFVVCAMKFHCYVRELSSWCKLRTRSYWTSIEGSLRYMYKLMKRRMFKVNAASSCHPVLQVTKQEVTWLGLTAYIRVLKRKESRHKELIHLLRAKLVPFSSFGASPELNYAVQDAHSSMLWKIMY